MHWIISPHCQFGGPFIGCAGTPIKNCSKPPMSFVCIFKHAILLDQQAYILKKLNITNCYLFVLIRKAEWGKCKPQHHLDNHDLGGFSFNQIDSPCVMAGRLRSA